MWLLVILIIILILPFIFSYLIINGFFWKRCEGNPNLRYFTVDDFEGLNAEKFEFKSDKGQILRGNIYTAGKENKGSVIFVHGFGGGHLSYTTEINRLAQNGFKVYAYDNTGTMASDGKKLYGFYQAILDLKACIEYIKDVYNEEVSIIGHSWGGYAAIQVLKYDLNIKSVVSMCAPDSFYKIIPIPIIREIVKVLSNNPKEGAIDALKNTDTLVLLLHGEKDKTCLLENSVAHGDFNDNVQKIVYEGKGHNLYQTIESEKYLIETFAKIKKDKNVYKEIDYKKITEEDDEVMETIIEFLNNTK